MTGVQTCALPISAELRLPAHLYGRRGDVVRQCKGGKDFLQDPVGESDPLRAAGGEYDGIGEKPHVGADIIRPFLPVNHSISVRADDIRPYNWFRQPGAASPPPVQAGGFCVWNGQRWPLS